MRQFKRLLKDYYKAMGLVFMISGFLMLVYPIVTNYYLTLQKPLYSKLPDNFIVSAATYKRIKTKDKKGSKILKYPINAHQLIIPRIGVDTKILIDKNPNNALKKGVLIINNFSTPDKKLKDMPVILASHKFGYANWSKEYREKNSFYNLYKLLPGDIIEIIWKGKKYTYVVKKLERDTAITDYTADLVLYTCEALHSPIRLFVYADLTKVE